MKKILILLTLVCAVSLSATGRIKLKKGDIVPFDGVLITEAVENKMIDKINTLEFRIGQFELVLPEKDEEMNNWVEQVANFNTRMKDIQAENSKMERRENILIANAFVGYTMLLAVIVGGVTYGVLEYTENGNGL